MVTERGPDPLHALHGYRRRNWDLRFRGVDGLAGWFEPDQGLRLEGLRHHERRFPPGLGSERTQVAYLGCGGWVVANADGTGEAQPIDELVWRSWRSGGLTEADLAQIGQVQH